MGLEVKRGFFGGRFHPFHNGHMSVLAQMDKDKDIDGIVIGICGSQYHRMQDNPFTSSERKKMIEASIHLEKPYWIVNIPDIHNYPKWVEHVEKRCPKFKYVYTGNEVVKNLFSEKGYEIKDTVRVNGISGTKIREGMLFDKPWQDLVPEGTLNVIKKIHGVDRIFEIYHKFPRPIVASDMIIVYKKDWIVFVERGVEPFIGFDSFPGGHLNVGFETTKETAIREAEEETGLKIDPQKVNLFGVYSNPQRDPRGHNIAIVYWTEINEGELKSGDDAKAVKLYKFNEIPEILAFDHKPISDDFKKFYYKQKYPILYPPYHLFAQD